MRNLRAAFSLALVVAALATAEGLQASCVASSACGPHDSRQYEVGASGLGHEHESVDSWGDTELVGTVPPADLRSQNVSALAWEPSVLTSEVRCLLREPLALAVTLFAPPFLALRNPLLII